MRLILQAADAGPGGFPHHRAWDEGGM